MNDEPAKKPGIGTMPWFKPVYRRVIVVAIVAIWCGWEWFFNQDQFGPPAVTFSGEGTSGTSGPITIGPQTSTV